MSGIAEPIRGYRAVMKAAMTIAAIFVSGCDETPGTPAIRDIALAEVHAFCAAHGDSPDCKILQFIACEEDSYPVKCDSMERDENSTRAFDLEYCSRSLGCGGFPFVGAWS